MRGSPTNLWGKLEREIPSDSISPIVSWHPLEDHCHDVTACFLALLELPANRRHMERLLGHRLDPVHIMRLLVFVFLHDIGKGNPGFQSKPFPIAEQHAFAPAGHIKEAIDLLRDQRWQQDAFASLRLSDMSSWFENPDDMFGVLFASLSHHGTPIDQDVARLSQVKTKTWATWRWSSPSSTLAMFAREIQNNFGTAFDGAMAFKSTPEFQSFFAGLLSIADWMGSDVRTFRYSMPGDSPRFEWACLQARQSMCDKGLNSDIRRLALKNRPSAYADIFGYSSPNPMQRAMAALNIPGLCSSTALSSISGSTVLLESETGSGKTEAAIYHGLELYRAGLIDGIYIALPTRTSGVQMHERVVKAMKAAFGDLAPPVVLAVPGYARVDDSNGALLPGFQVRWDDKSDLAASRGWFSENAKRYLAAPIAVGTIDQVLMSVLRAKHAHMRAACVSRSLIIIDEVHASDTYMAALTAELIRRHYANGGHSLLMSATLGAEAARSYVGGPSVDLADAKTLQYPLIRYRTAASPEPIVVEIKADGAEPVRSKQVSVKTLALIGDDLAVARLAAQHASQGAKVLVIRNTVAGCIAVRKALDDLLPAEQVFRCRGVSAPHHGRFAPEDRKLLDEEIQVAFGKKRVDGGLVLVATQTVEQSLDIDADILITDICPMDVLLQRIGRLHRHLRPSPELSARPPNFVDAQCLVLVPAGGLMQFTGKAGFGIGKDRAYHDVAIVELTRRLIEAHPILDIPRMNRALVEAAVHSEAKRTLEQESAAWKHHRSTVIGVASADGMVAKTSLLVVDKPFGSPEQFEGWGDSKISTRLGDEPITAMFDPTNRPRSPFPSKNGGPGERIPFLAIPRWMASKTPNGVNLSNEMPVIIETSDKGFTFAISGQQYRYDQDGLRSLK